MFNVIIVIILFNIIFIGFLFWFLTFLGRYFFFSKNIKVQYENFECGFKTLSDINLSINFSFFITALFILLYEFELIVFIPYLFNLFLINNFIIILIFLLIFIIIFTLWLDINYNVIHWFF